MSSTNKIKIDRIILEYFDWINVGNGQIIVHCQLDVTGYKGCSFRIWPSTYLIDPISKCKIKMLFAYNISTYPTWSYLPQQSQRIFTLIFGRLPQECLVFDLVEEVEGGGAFEVRGIKRNKSDVYIVKIKY